MKMKPELDETQVGFICEALSWYLAEFKPGQKEYSQIRSLHDLFDDARDELWGDCSEEVV